MYLQLFAYRCVGTVTQYCGSSEEHFVVFDEDCLQSQWMVITVDSTDVLLGGEEDRKAGMYCIVYVSRISIFIPKHALPLPLPHTFALLFFYTPAIFYRLFLYTPFLTSLYQVLHLSSCQNDHTISTDKVM